MRVGPETIRAVREKAERLCGADLGERGDALTEIAVQRALAYCQRDDVPEEMEAAVSVLLLALTDQFPAPKENASLEDCGGESFLPGGGAADLGAESAVKSIQRGDTTIVFDTSAPAGGSASSGAGNTSFPGEAAALAGLVPWRRLGRLKREVL